MSRIRTVVASEILLLLGLLGFVGGAYLVEEFAGADRVFAFGTLGALALAAVPALGWLLYFYAQDRHEPEPEHYVLGVFLLGGFCAGPVAQFLIDASVADGSLLSPAEGPLGPLRLIEAFLIVALAQELAKYVTVRYTVYPSREFDEPIDGIVYATAAGLGFATYDNLTQLLALGEQVRISVAAADVVTTTLAHACTAGVIGFALGVAKFSARQGRRVGVLLLGIMVAVALNGSFFLVRRLVQSDGMELFTWRSVAFSFGFAAGLFLVLSVLIRRLLNQSGAEETA